MHQSYRVFRACFADIDRQEHWRNELAALVKASLGDDAEIMWRAEPARIETLAHARVRQTGGVVEAFDDGADAPPYRYMIKTYARPRRRDET